MHSAKTTTSRLLVVSSLMLVLSSMANATGPLAVKDVVMPTYPPLVRMAQIQGDVPVEIEISAEGQVVSANVTGGHKMLQEAVVKNVKLWTFSPIALEKGTTYRHTITYHFALGERSAHPACPNTVFHFPDRVEIFAEPPEVEP
jgi:TonB family protein